MLHNLRCSRELRCGISIFA